MSTHMCTHIDVNKHTCTCTHTTIHTTNMCTHTTIHTAHMRAHTPPSTLYTYTHTSGTLVFARKVLQSKSEIYRYSERITNLNRVRQILKLKTEGRRKAGREAGREGGSERVVFEHSK